MKNIILIVTSFLCFVLNAQYPVPLIQVEPDGVNVLNPDQIDRYNFLLGELPGGGLCSQY